MGDPTEGVRDGTRALKDIAAEVEAERAAGHRAGVPSDDASAEGAPRDEERDDEEAMPWGVAGTQLQTPYR